MSESRFRVGVQLKIIDAELRRAHAAVDEMLEPILASAPLLDPEHVEARDTRKALHTAGWMASGLHCWPHQPPH